jgi:dihydrofolate reductase
MPSPHISFVVAMAENRVIGRGDALPWHLPADLRHFKAITLGKPVIMGRRTHESIGRPLPGRLNIVVTRLPGYAAPGCVVVDSPEAALAAAMPANEVMVIGGEQIFRALLGRAERIYLTLVHASFAGDAVFPELDAGWQTIAQEDHPADATNPHAYSFVVLAHSTRAVPRP